MAVDHFVLLERVDANAVLGRGSEFASGDCVGIRPHSIFRIVRKVHAGRECIPIVAASRIAGCGDRNAVVVSGAARGELRQEPAVHKLVVQYDWVAGWICAVRDCEAAPQRPRIDGPEQQSAGLGIDTKN